MRSSGAATGWTRGKGIVVGVHEQDRDVDQGEHEVADEPRRRQRLRVAARVTIQPHLDRVEDRLFGVPERIRMLVLPRWPAVDVPLRAGSVVLDRLSSGEAAREDVRRKADMDRGRPSDPGHDPERIGVAE